MQWGLNLSTGLQNVANAAAAAQATADAAVPATHGFLPWGVSALWGTLTHEPHKGGVLSTSTAEDGRIVYGPCCPVADITLVQFAIEQTNTPAGTTLVAYLARYTMLDDGTPGTLVVDYTASGGVVFTNAAAVDPLATIAFPAITIPRGRWHLAVRFAGTNGAPAPVVRTVTHHPSIGASTLKSLNINGGYRSPDLTNVVFPPVAAIGADQGRGAVLVFAKRA